MASPYTNGTTIKFTITYTVASVATDPTTVTFYIKSPTGVLETFVYGTDSEITKTATGVYQMLYSLALDAALGTWSYAWYANSTYKKTDVGEFENAEWDFD